MPRSKRGCENRGKRQQAGNRSHEYSHLANATLIVKTNEIGFFEIFTPDSSLPENDLVVCAFPNSLIKFYVTGSIEYPFKQVAYLIIPFKPDELGDRRTDNNIRREQRDYRCTVMSLGCTA
jgi:hypothetical protein